MVQWLAVLVFPAEDEGLIPSTHMEAHNHLTPLSGDQTPSSGLQALTGYPEIYAVKTSTHKNLKHLCSEVTHTHNTHTKQTLFVG